MSFRVFTWLPSNILEHQDLLQSHRNLNYQRKPAYGGFADGLANKK